MLIIYLFLFWRIRSSEERKREKKYISIYVYLFSIVQAWSICVIYNQAIYNLDVIKGCQHFCWYSPANTKKKRKEKNAGKRDFPAKRFTPLKIIYTVLKKKKKNTSQWHVILYIIIFPLSLFDEKTSKHEMSFMFFFSQFVSNVKIWVTKFA